MDRQNNISGALLVLGAGVLWGTVGPAHVLAGSGAGAAALGGARILSGGLVLAAVVLATNPRAFRALSRPTWPPLLTAAAATGIFQVAFLSAVDRTGAAVATAVVFGLAPVSAGVCERLALGTRLPRRWGAATACAIGGCALLVLPGSDVRVDLYGVALSLLGGGCFGVYTVSAKSLIGHRVGMAAAVSVTLLAGGALLLPWTAAGLPELITPRSLALVGWLGVAATAVAYMAFVAGLRRVTAATAATLSLVEPLVAAALALLVLGERLSVPVAAGALLLLGGLALASAPSRRAPSRQAPSRPRRTWPGRGRDRYAGAHATGAVKVDPTTGERE